MKMEVDSMKKLGKICTIALLAGLSPYCVQKDEETGEIEVKSLLWSLKKTPGEEEDVFTFELLPLLNRGGDKEPGEKTEEKPLD